MLFSSITFLFYFLPFVVILSLIIKGNKWKNLFLMFASIVFFAWGETEMVFLLLLTIYINYILAIQIDKQEKLSSRKLYLTLALIFNIGLLGYYKYMNFFLINFSSGINIQQITLPIGISFYTFHNVSYVIDVFKRKVAAQKDLVNLALYISFFPQLIAGPIVRYVDIADQLYNRIVDTEIFSYGVKRFITGLAKKVLIANACAGVADQVFALPYEDLHFTVSWLGILAYTLQIYFDFSGYSDMAIGLGRMFGFRFLENFNFPYIAKSMQDFWRRWHISLSSWFRDYLYIPLGGNKVGPVRLYVNLFLVFLCTGFWHGASWNFIVWGILHGVFLIIERLGFGKILEKMPSFVGHAYTMIVVFFTWVFFRADDLTTALKYCETMIGIHQGDSTYSSLYDFIDHYNIFIMVLGVFLVSPHLRLKNAINNTLVSLPSLTARLLSSQLKNLSYLVLLVLAIMNIANGTYNPFIYFRF